MTTTTLTRRYDPDLGLGGSGGYRWHTPKLFALYDDDDCADARSITVEQLVEYRLRVGISQRDVAREFGVSVGHISHWENHVRPCFTHDRLTYLALLRRVERDITEWSYEEPQLLRVRAGLSVAQVAERVNIDPRDAQLWDRGGWNAARLTDPDVPTRWAKVCYVAYRRRCHRRVLR